MTVHNPKLHKFGAISGKLLLRVIYIHVHVYILASFLFPVKVARLFYKDVTLYCFTIISIMLDCVQNEMLCTKHIIVFSVGISCSIVLSEKDNNRIA